MCAPLSFYTEGDDGGDLTRLVSSAPKTPRTETTNTRATKRPPPTGDATDFVQKEPHGLWRGGAMGDG